MGGDKEKVLWEETLKIDSPHSKGFPLSSQMGGDKEKVLWEYSGRRP